MLKLEIEEMKELMDGKYEVIERYIHAITRSAKMFGYYNAQIMYCDVQISGADTWEECKYYIEKRNIWMSCRMNEKETTQFYKKLLMEYI